MTNRKYLSCAETAKMVRDALKEAFPAVKFGVRSSTYSGGASITIKWTDGPTSKQVESVTNSFEGSYFDGMIDYKGNVYHEIDGEPVSFGADFIFTSREYSDAKLAQGIAAIVEGYGGCEAVTVEDYRNGLTRNWKNSGGCDLERALNLWLSGENEASWISADPGMEPKKSSTVGRVKFAGSDEYGSPYGARGYPQAA
jgi:hypothetical protein